MSNVIHDPTSTKFFPEPLNLSHYTVSGVSASKTPSPAKKRRIDTSSAASTSSVSSPAPSEADALSRARLQSSMRVISIWNSLEAKYAKDLAKDDIVDLATGNIIQDTGVIRSAPDGKWKIGCFGGAEKELADGHVSGDDQWDEDDDGDDDEDFEGWSRIDEQYAVPPPLPRVTPPKSYVSFASLAQDDKDNLDQFLRAEAERKAREGDIDATLDAMTITESEVNENEGEIAEDGSSDIGGSQGDESERLNDEDDETSADELSLVGSALRGRSLSRGIPRTKSRAPSPPPRASSPNPRSSCLPKPSFHSKPRLRSRSLACTPPYPTSPSSPESLPHRKLHRPAQALACARSPDFGGSSLRGISSDSEPRSRTRSLSRTRSRPVSRRKPSPHREPSIEIGWPPEVSPQKFLSLSPLSLSPLPQLDLLSPKRAAPQPNPQCLQTPPISHASVEPVDMTSLGSTVSPSSRKPRKVLQFDPVIQYSAADDPSLLPDQPASPTPSHVEEFDSDVQFRPVRKRKRESRGPSPEPEDAPNGDSCDPLDRYSDVEPQYVSLENDRKPRSRYTPARTGIPTRQGGANINTSTPHLHHPSSYRAPFPSFPLAHDPSWPPDPNVLAQVMHSINYLVSHSNFGGPATPPENPAMRSLYPPQHRPSYPYYPYPHPETTLSPAPPPTLNLSSIPYPSRSSYFPRHDYSRCELPSRAGSMLHSSHNSARSRSVQPGSGHRSPPERPDDTSSLKTPKSTTRRKSLTTLFLDDNNDTDEDQVPHSPPTRFRSRIPTFKRPSDPSPSEKHLSMPGVSPTPPTVPASLTASKGGTPMIPTSLRPTNNVRSVSQQPPISDGQSRSTRELSRRGGAAMAARGKKAVPEIDFLTLTKDNSRTRPPVMKFDCVGVPQLLRRTKELPRRSGKG